MSESKKNIFLTKSRLIVFVISFSILIALIAITLTSILKINFKTLGNNISASYQKNKLIILYLIIIFLIFPIFRSFYFLSYYFLEIKKLNFKTSFFDLFSMSIIYIFIVSITPAAIGGEPYLIYWLRKKGLSVKQASALVLMNSTCAHLSGTIITLPSYFYIIFTYKNLVNVESWNIIFWFSTIGLIDEIIVFISFIILSFSVRLHYWISLIFNYFLKILKLKHKTNKELIDQKSINTEFKKILISYYKTKTIPIYIFLSTFVYNFFLYSLMYISLCSIFDSNFFHFHEVFNFTNVATTANNFIPLPGSEGSLQYLLSLMLNLEIDVSNNYINESIFIWRSGSGYVNSLLGFIFIIFSCYHLWKRFQNKKYNKNPIKQNILIITNRAHNTIGGIENYNKMLIKIFSENNCNVHELKLVPNKYVESNKFISDSVLKTNEIIFDEKWALKTKDFDQLEKSSQLKQFSIMYKFIFYSRKIVKKHLLQNSYDMIIDSTIFGMHFLFNNDKYIWVQHNSKKSRNGQIFNNCFLNFFGLLATKILGFKNTFKYAKNVVLFDQYNEKDINIKNKFFYNVSLPYLHEIKNIENKNKNEIIYVGRVEKDQKRIDLLIKASKHILSKIKVYGTGPMVEEIKNNKYTEYSGTFDNKEVAKIYKNAKLLVILSNHEGFCFSAVEAISNCVPVIMRDTFPSAKLFAQDINTVYLIDKRLKPKEIAQKINDYIKYIDLNKNTVQNKCYQLANKYFRFELFKNSWIKIYNEINK